MEETLKRKKKHNIEYLTDERYDQIGSFAKQVAGKYKGLVASVLVQNPRKAHETIDIMFMIDDLNNVVLDQQAAEIKVDAAEIAYKTDLPLKCEVMLASVFWDGFKAKDNSIIQIARDALAVHDNGFFMPIQDLLVTGKIRPSKESVNVYFVKAERSMKTADQKVQRGIIDLYWAVFDSAHAAVMVAGIMPPSPKDLAEALKRELVARNLIHRRCAGIVDRFYDAAKKVMHREVFSVSGREFDSYLADADFFIKEINEFVKEHVK